MRCTHLRPRFRSARLLALAGLALACGPPPVADVPVAPDALPGPIVTTERGARGGRLVVVREDGARIAELTRGDAEPIIDSTPAFAPDGQVVAFASTRGQRGLDRSNLWLVPARPGAAPRRLTEGDASDRDPLWVDDGRALVFASNRAGSFDLWRAPLRTGADGLPELAAEPAPLTAAPTQELSPSLSPDGRTVVYMALDEDGRSTLWTIPVAGGAPRPLTDGPLDLTPAFGPDGRVVFAAASDAGGANLFLLDPDTGARELLFDPEHADVTGPVWSPSGRFVFATAVFRSAVDQRALLSSVVVLDLEAAPRVLRALHDPAAVESRLGVTLAPGALDAAALAGNEPYDEALRRALTQERIRRQEE